MSCILLQDQGHTPDLLVVMPHWAADLDSGPLVHSRHAPDLELDGGLARVALHEVLRLLGPDLGVGHVLALRHVALLLAGGGLLVAAQAVALVNQLTQTQELLTADLAIPDPAPTSLGALKHEKDDGHEADN